jgi:hypothetical protein
VTRSWLVASILNLLVLAHMLSYYPLSFALRNSTIGVLVPFNKHVEEFLLSRLHSNEVGVIESVPLSTLSYIVLVVQDHFST